MKRSKLAGVIVLTAGSSMLVSSLFIGSGCQMDAQTEPAEETEVPRVVADNPVEAGRYLVVIGGCNDCHTPEYRQTGGEVPEEDWLTGSTLGWRGPWGTTYGSNLRRYVQTVSEDEWVEILHTREAFPPMPWMNTHQMSEPDLRAIYRYIESLGPKGETMPSRVPPDQDPETPYLSMTPRNMEAASPEQEE